MRVVLDTNTLVSGVISPSGPPRRLLNGARAQTFELCSSATLLAELRRLAHMAEPREVPRVIEHDADDDHVLACAVAGGADLIVSGDKHLHSLGGQYRNIPIVTATQAVARIGA